GGGGAEAVKRPSTRTVKVIVSLSPSAAIARAWITCCPASSRLVSHVPESPLKTYGALRSVQRQRPSIQNSTRVAGPVTSAVQRTLPESGCPSPADMPTTWTEESFGGGGTA